MAEEEPEEEDEHLGNLDEEEIKKLQSDEVLSLILFLFRFWGFIFCPLVFPGASPYCTEMNPKCKGQ